MNSNIASFGFIECCQDGKWTRQLRVKLSVHSYKQHSFRCVRRLRALLLTWAIPVLSLRFDLNLPSTMKTWLMYTAILACDCLTFCFRLAPVEHHSCWVTMGNLFPDKRVSCCCRFLEELKRVRTRCSMSLC